MAKNKNNFETLFKTLKDAGWVQSHAQEIYDALADAYLAVNPGRQSYADYLDALSRYGFQEELNRNIRPFVKQFALKMARNNKGTDYDKENLRAFLKATNEKIDREGFLNLLGRKAEETVDKDGNRVKSDRHIGRLTDDDYDNLYVEGYDRDFVDELADRFRKEYIAANAEKILSARPKMMKDARDSVVKEYNKSPLSGTLKAIAPELYAEGVKAMKEGRDIEDGDLGRAVAMDLGRNAGIVASAAMPNPFLTGAGVFGTEMTFNGVSPNYKQSAGQAAIAGTAAATIPTMVGRAVGGLSRIPVRDLQKAVRNASNKFRRGEVSPSTRELMDRQELVDNAIETYIAAKIPGSGVRMKDAKKLVSEITRQMNESPLAVKAGNAGSFNETSVAAMMETEEGQRMLRTYLAKAPSKSTYVETSDIAKGPASASRPIEQSARNRAEKWLDAVQDQWPETARGFVTLPVGARQRLLNYGTEMSLGALNSVGGVVEPMSTRIGSVLPYGRPDNGGIYLIDDWRKEYGGE